MTEEEYQAKVDEYNRLVERYNYLVQENANLEAEINMIVNNCYIVAENISKVAQPVVKDVKYLSDNLDVVTDEVETLYRALVDITEKYSLFKNLSTASKNLTQYNDQYYTKFHFYNELRRITLGFIIGVDSCIVGSETIRKKVEKAYLANTDYWLAYAISAVMLWASDEHEAAYRALNKSLTMDVCKTSIFFMLVNLRFRRITTAKNWFINLLDKTDVSRIPEEWQHILHLYLTGAMQTDPELQKMAESYFVRMLEQTWATHADFSRKISDHAYAFAKTFLHTTEQSFPDLSSFCPEYQDIRHLLGESEKVMAITEYYKRVLAEKEDEAYNMNEDIENVLYDLISSYDAEEFKIIKEIRYNEAVLAAKGDIAAANAKFQQEYGKMYQTMTFGELMLNWAFCDDTKAVDVSVRRFSISRFRSLISHGITTYLTECRQAVKDKYPITVYITEGMKPLQLECSEADTETCSEAIRVHYHKNRLRYTLSDKYMKIFLFLCAGALLLLAIAAMTVGNVVFPVFLTLGIALGILSGVLVWKRSVDLHRILEEKCRLAVDKFSSCMTELGSWREQLLKNYEHLGEIEDVLNQFE